MIRLLNTTRCRLKVFGKVQGIGFRYFCRETAQDMGVSGWVRNCSDGTVELEAEALPELLSRFKEHVKSGHPWARVERVEEETLPPLKNSKTDFDVVF